MKGLILRPPVPLRRRHPCYRAKEVGYLSSILHLGEISLRRVDFNHKLELYLSSLGVSIHVLEGLLEIDTGTDRT